MNNPRIPLIGRPLIPDDSFNLFRSTLDALEFDQRPNPCLQLITTTEVQSMTPENKLSAYENMAKLADELLSKDPTYATVLRARLYFPKKVGYLSLSLAVDAGVGKERTSITSVLQEGGVDIANGPFPKYEYQTIVASCVGYAIPREELFEAINNACPRRVVLGSPSLQT